MSAIRVLTDCHRPKPYGPSGAVPGDTVLRTEEALEPGQVVRVEVVDPCCQQFGPDGVALGSRDVGRRPEADALPAAVGGADEERSLSRSAAGNGPAPSQPKLSVQLLLMSGMNEAVAAVPRSSSLPS